jgi:hypothetical protein
MSLEKAKIGSKIKVISRSGGKMPEIKKVIRMTPKYVELEGGNKYRISDGKPSGFATGARAEMN